MRTVVILAEFTLQGACLTAQAGSLQVSPITVEVNAPSSSSVLTLQNPEARELRAQIRVFKWSKNGNGEDTLEPATDVIASPPAANLKPRTNYTVRIVRTAKQPISGEESYRVFVDELPDPALQRNGAVGIVLRQSIPVFFGASDRTRPDIEWSVVRTGGETSLVAVNKGQRRVRLSRVMLQDETGRKVAFSNGLVGYALAESTSRWTKPLAANLRGLVSIKAETDAGPLDVRAAVRSH